MVSRETEEHIAEEAVEGGIAILLWEGFTRGVKYVWRHWLGPQLQKHSDVVIEGARQKVAEKINDDRREELLELFMQLPPADRVNLMRRHLAAMNGEARISENTFASLLLKIPVEKREARLKWLNILSDGEFWQMMYLQEHDPVHQWLEQARRNLRRLDQRTAFGLDEHRRAVDAEWWAHPGRLPVVGIVIDPIGWFQYKQELRQQRREERRRRREERRQEQLAEEAAPVPTEQPGLFHRPPRRR